MNTAWNFPGAAHPRVRRVIEDEQRQRIEHLQACTALDHGILWLGYRPTREYVERTYDVPVVPVVAPAGFGREPRSDAVPAEFAEEDEAPSPTRPLAQRLRAEAGPTVDAWIDEVRQTAATARSLPDLARRIEDLAGAPARRLEPLAGVLQSALAAADLAGRYDVDQTRAPVEFVEPSFEHARLGFDDQIRFFRRKLSIPTRA